MTGMVATTSTTNDQPMFLEEFSLFSASIQNLCPAYPLIPFDLVKMMDPSKYLLLECSMHPDPASDNVLPKLINVLCIVSCRSLRTYPPRFGMRLLKLHGRFCRERVADWSMISDDTFHMDLGEYFQSLPWGDLWEDANCVSILAYIRASKALHLGKWRNLIPMAF